MDPGGELARRATIKAGRYERILDRLREELAKSLDPVARMATIASMLHHRQPHFFWTGFYRLVDGRLVVGPYQGGLACQNIEVGEGVCGTAFLRGATIVVPDVREFPGHIPCDTRSRSEIVVPYRDAGGALAGVLDVDSTEMASFDAVDAEYLEQVVAQLPPA